MTLNLDPKFAVKQARQYLDENPALRKAYEPMFAPENLARYANMSGEEVVLLLISGGIDFGNIFRGLGLSEVQMERIRELPKRLETPVQETPGEQSLEGKYISYLNDLIK